MKVFFIHPSSFIPHPFYESDSAFIPQCLRHRHLRFDLRTACRNAFVLCSRRFGHAVFADYRHLSFCDGCRLVALAFYRKGSRPKICRDRISGCHLRRIFRADSLFKFCQSKLFCSRCSTASFSVSARSSVWKFPC